MQSDPADDLNIEGNHVPGQFMTAYIYNSSAKTAAGIFHDSEGFAHDIIRRLAILKTIFEFLCFCLQLIIGESLILFFQFIDFPDKGTDLFDIPLGLASENRF